LENAKQHLHDLKQPLNAIRLLAGNMKNRVILDQSIEDKLYYQNKLDKIEQQVDQLSRSLNDIFEQF
jgi:signal transduction histidine kinase